MAAAKRTSEDELKAIEMELKTGLPEPAEGQIDADVKTSEEEIELQHRKWRARCDRLWRELLEPDRRSTRMWTTCRVA